MQEYPQNRSSHHDAFPPFFFETNRYFRLCVDTEGFAKAEKNPVILQEVRLVCLGFSSLIVDCYGNFVCFSCGGPELTVKGIAGTEAHGQNGPEAVAGAGRHGNAAFGFVALNPAVVRQNAL